MKTPLKNLTVSIGIPTYEAGLSLVSTLNSIYAQAGFKNVQRIILIVDGNKIYTEIMKQINNSKLKVISGKQRKGQSQRINDIFESADSDFLILTNDDVVWEKNTLKEMTEKYTSTNADLISGNVFPLKAKSLMETVLKIGIDINREIYETWNKSDNYLSCNGRIVGLSKKLYKKIQIPASLWNNDAYMYLFAKVNNFKFGFAKKAIIFFRSPSTLNEHIKQSSKFRFSMQENSKFFKQDLNEFYKVPKSLLIKSLIESAFRSPMMTFFYLVITLKTSLHKTDFSKNKNGFWNTDKSTKKLEVI